MGRSILSFIINKRTDPNTPPPFLRTTILMSHYIVSALPIEANPNNTKKTVTGGLLVHILNNANNTPRTICTAPSPRERFALECHHSLHSWATVFRARFSRRVFLRKFRRPSQFPQTRNYLHTNITNEHYFLFCVVWRPIHTHIHALNTLYAQENTKKQYPQHAHDVRTSLCARVALDDYYLVCL